MKLDGIRILDLSFFLPGPYLTQMMADQGAKVIKLKPINGGEPKQDGWSIWALTAVRPSPPLYSECGYACCDNGAARCIDGLAQAQGDGKGDYIDLAPTDALMAPLPNGMLSAQADRVLNFLPQQLYNRNTPGSV